MSLYQRIPIIRIDWYKMCIHKKRSPNSHFRPSTIIVYMISRELKQKLPQIFPFPRPYVLSSAALRNASNERLFPSQTRFESEFEVECCAYDSDNNSFLLFVT